MKTIEDEFTTEILAKSTIMILGKCALIGRRRFKRNRRNVNKLMEIKQSTMTEMRLLSKQLIAFSEETTAANVSAEDMFIRTNFAVLKAAIEKVTNADGKSTLKHRVQNGIYYLM